MKVLSPQQSVLAPWPIERALPGISPRPAAAREAPAARRVHSVELRNTVSLLVAILLISAVSLLFMTQTGSLATSGYQISQLQAQKDQLQRENEQLSVQLAQLHSLPYIQKVATEQLHMTKSDLSQVQYVNLTQQQLDVAKQP